jgi:hypothetical protein
MKENKSVGVVAYLNNLLHNLKTNCDSLTDEQFTMLLEDFPRPVIQSQSACKRLTDEQFDYCIKKDQDDTPLMYALDRLSNKQFEDQIRKHPWTALMNKEANARLSDTQFDYCLKHAPCHPCPEYVLKRMNPIQLDDYVKSFYATYPSNYPVNRYINTYQKSWLDKV